MNFELVIAGFKGTIYAGSTDDMEGRKSKHEYKGFSAVIYYAETENMMRAENKFFENHGSLRYNKHKRATLQKHVAMFV